MWGGAWQPCQWSPGWGGCCWQGQSWAVHKRPSSSSPWLPATLSGSCPGQFNAQKHMLRLQACHVGPSTLSATCGGARFYIALANCTLPEYMYTLFLCLFVVFAFMLKHFHRCTCHCMCNAGNKGLVSSAVKMATCTFTWHLHAVGPAPLAAISNQTLLPLSF